MQFGVLYVATGENYRKEANRSAATVKQAMPDIPIAIHTDDPESCDDRLFDIKRLIENPQYHFIDKILPLSKTPFEKTLFLDTDTLMLEAVYDLSDLLDRFELAYCHTPARVSKDFHVACPESFPEPNTGVILFRNTQRVRNVIEQWYDLYKRQLNLKSRPKTDQPAFRQAVYESTLNYTILPPEYNIRTVFPIFIGRELSAKILHGDIRTMRRVEKVTQRKKGYITGNWNYDRALNPISNKLLRMSVRIFKPWLPSVVWRSMKRTFGR